MFPRCWIRCNGRLEEDWTTRVHSACSPRLCDAVCKPVGKVRPGVYCACPLWPNTPCCTCPNTVSVLGGEGGYLAMGTPKGSGHILPNPESSPNTDLISFLKVLYGHFQYCPQRWGYTGRVDSPYVPLWEGNITSYTP